jgi:hypothetical protein
MVADKIRSYTVNRNLFVTKQRPCSHLYCIKCNELQSDNG